MLDTGQVFILTVIRIWLDHTWSIHTQTQKFVCTGDRDLSCASVHFGRAGSWHFPALDPVLTVTRWHSDGWWRTRCVLSHQTQSCSSCCPSQLWLQRVGCWLLCCRGSAGLRTSQWLWSLLGLWPLILSIGSVNPLQLLLFESSLFTSLKLPPVAGLALPAPPSPCGALGSSGVSHDDPRDFCAVGAPHFQWAPVFLCSGICPHGRGWRHWGLQEHHGTSTIWNRSDRNLFNYDQWENTWTASPLCSPCLQGVAEIQPDTLAQKKTKPVKKTTIWANKGREPSRGGRDSLESFLTATILRMNQSR